MPQLAIIADDLTGALDAAAPFVGADRRITVATSPTALPEALASDADVIAVSTRSREGSAAEAKACVSDVVSSLPRGVAVFKKIDSRMKGHIAVEVSAFDPIDLLVCPAIPDMGRYVRGGYVTGAGVDEPISVAAALGPLNDGAIVPDAETMDDMSASLRRLPNGGLMVGARGLAAALARQMFDADATGPLVKLPLPALLVVGSTDPVTLAQIAALKSLRIDLVVVPAPAGAVPASSLPVSDLTVLQATRSDITTAPNAVAASLAAGTASYLASSNTVFATGGATAEALFDAMGASVLTLVGEAAPGMPVCRWNGLHMVTKSGGFGAPDSLVRMFPVTERA